MGDGARYLQDLEPDPELGSDERGKPRVDENDGPCRAGQSPHSSTRAKAAGSLLPSLGAAAVWEKCEPLQFNDALILLPMRAFLVPTTEETRNSACVYTWVGHSFHYIGSAWRRGHEKLGGIGQRWLEHVGLVRRMCCRDRNEGEKLRYRLGDSSDADIEAEREQ